MFSTASCSSFRSPLLGARGIHQALLQCRDICGENNITRHRREDRTRGYFTFYTSNCPRTGRLRAQAPGTGRVPSEDDSELLRLLP